MSEAATAQSAKKYRVLIVDDKPEMRKAFSNLLYFEEELTVVGTAEDGADAVKKVQELEPDVILMDVEMPVMDGITATRQIKTERPSAIIVAVSSELRYKANALQAGASAFLTKPFSPEEFVEALKTQV
jgi:pilus assembly protein CpaE